MTHIKRNPLVSMDFVILISLFFYTFAVGNGWILPRWLKKFNQDANHQNLGTNQDWAPDG